MNFVAFFCFTGNFFTSILEHFTFLLKLLFISFLSLLIHLEHLGGERHKSETFLITCTLLESQKYLSEHNNIYIYIYIYIKFYADVALILSQTKERLILQITQQTFVGFQDILKTSTLSTHLQRNNFSSSKTSWRNLWRHLTSLWRPKIVMLRTSSRRLEDMSWILLLDVLETNKVFTGNYCLQII